MKITSTLFLFLLLFPLAANSAQVGKPAPAFSLKDLKGNIVTLESFKGKVVFLDFWTPWCIPCKEEMPEMEALYKKLGDKGFEIVGIAVDASEKTILQFLRKIPLSYAILLDDKGMASDAYRCSNLPTAFIIGRDGIIHYLHKGFGIEFLPLYEKEVMELLKQ